MLLLIVTLCVKYWSFSVLNIDVGVENYKPWLVLISLIGRWIVPPVVSLVENRVSLWKLYGIRA